MGWTKTFLGQVAVVQLARSVAALLLVGIQSAGKLWPASHKQEKLVSCISSVKNDKLTRLSLTTSQSEPGPQPGGATGKFAPPKTFKNMFSG